VKIATLSSSWSRVQFGDVCSLRAENIHPSEIPNAVYVGLEHIDPGNPRLSRSGLPSEVNSSKSKFYTGDVLYGKLRPYLDKAVLAEQDGICSTDILVFKNTSETLGEFLVYRIHSSEFLDYAKRTTRGVNHPRTSWASLKEFEFEIPAICEQRAIARVLRAVQEAKEVRQRELSLERERKAALMQYLFMHGTRGEARKQTELGELPVTWRIVRLGDIASVVSGGTPDRSNPDYWNGDLPWVRTGEINYNLILDTGERITPEGLINSSARIIPKQTLLMAMYGQGVTRGRVAILGIDSAINQACAALLLNNNDSVEYLFHFLAFRYKSIRNLGHGANQKNLNSALVRSIPILLPTPAEQTEIAEVLCSCDTKVNALETEELLLDELFKSMLEELMTGRLSVLPLGKSEPAELETSLQHS
jgi:type I restriction enzyme, S subunit